MYETYSRQNTSKITTKSSDVAYLPPLWRHASLLNDGSCSFIHPVVKDRRIEVREERRQARKIVWPVNAGILICRYQNDLCGIINHHKYIRYCFLDVKVAGSSIITINHIDTDAKTAGDTRCPLWRTRLLDAGSCCFKHPAFKGNHYSFAPKILAVML